LLTFQNELNKSYDTRRDEKDAFSNFKDSFELVKTHNENFTSGNSTFQLSLNKYADEPEEFFVHRLNFDMAGEMDMRGGDEELPPMPRCTLKYLNYTELGYVNTVRNQGRCGACYAFAVAGACEATFKKKFNTLYKIAEQQLVDCTKNAEYGNRGCLGGKLSTTYAYLASQMAMNDSNYPYRARDNDSCLYNEDVAISTIDNFVRLSNINESYLMDLLCEIGPISVGIDASSRTFQYYSSGVYYESGCGRYINHAMVSCK
jgi:hypothetical protein